MKTATRKPPFKTDDEYRQLRYTLVRYLAWNGAQDPEDLADETILRVLKNLESGEEIRDLPAFARTTAQHVLSENLRRQARRFTSGAALSDPSESFAAERFSRCLEACKKRLARADKELIETYYSGDKGEMIANRKKLAKRFGLSAGALNSRAFRIRQKLSSCLDGCLRKRGGE